MSKTRTHTILAALATIATAVWAALAWLYPPSGTAGSMQRTAYGVQEGRQLVMLRDSRGHTALVVEDADGHTLFGIPVRNCVVASRFEEGRLRFRMRESGQEGYIDTLGTAYLTSQGTLPQAPDEGRNTAQVEAREAQPASRIHQDEPGRQPQPAATRQSVIALADLRRMARSNPFYAEAARVMQGRLEEGDSANRHKILDYCEHLRTAYTRRDLPFLRQVFSDRALIIVGSVVSSAAQQDGARGADMVRYSVRTKEEYLERLERVFQTNRRVNVQFSDFSIMRHPTTDGIYGVQLRQKYQTDRYADDGYLFLLWDFRDPSRPLIHVRTWQPEDDVRGGAEKIDLSNFNLQ